MLMQLVKHVCHIVSEQTSGYGLLAFSSRLARPVVFFLFEVRERCSVYHVRLNY